MTSFWDSASVSGGRMRLYLSFPESGGPHPAIVVVHGQSGVEDFLEVNRMLARAGYVAAAPDLFHRDGPNCKDDGPTRRARLRDGTVIQDVTAALEFLKQHERVDGTRLGIVGFCMGGRVAYLMAAVNPDLRAAVMYYGGDTTVPWGEGPSPFQRTAQIGCPLLGHFGEEDENPSPADMEKLDAELTKHGKEHEFHSYPGVGHAFANPNSPKYHAATADASWAKTFDFFARYLGVREPEKAAAGASG